MIEPSKTIDFFIGLPGSGKTSAAKSLIFYLESNIKNEGNINSFYSKINNSCSCQPIVLVDDLYLQLKETDFNWEQVLVVSKEPRNIVITDFLACDPKQQIFIFQKLKQLFPLHKQNWFFFDNDILQCLKNVEQRNNGKNVHITISQMNKIYSINPSLIDCVDLLSQIPVYSPNISTKSKIK